MSEQDITTTVVVLMLAIPYFLPALIGLLRNHHQKWAILALDTLLGWTLIGWVAALVWAFTKKERSHA